MRSATPAVRRPVHGTRRDGRQTTVPRWRLVVRRSSENSEAVYDVYREDHRVAWGLTDRVRAKRWLQRLAMADATLVRRAARHCEPWWALHD
jgi:hypothetical protein